MEKKEMIDQLELMTGINYGSKADYEAIKADAVNILGNDDIASVNAVAMFGDDAVTLQSDLKR